MPFDPDKSLGFLVADIARLLREQFNGTAQSLGLTLAQGRALAHLARNEGISQAALAQILEVQPITLLRQLDKLTEAGLIERRRHPTDRRAQQLFLTATAGGLLDQIAELGETLTETALLGLSVGDREQLYALLRRVKGNLSTSTDPEPRAVPSDPQSRL